MTATTTRSKLERERFFDDWDEVPATVKHPDDEIAHTHDWTNDLASGETISSAVYTAEFGLTKASETTSSPNTTVTVSKTGELKIEITTSASRTLTKRWRFYDRDRQQRTKRDYGANLL